MTSEQNELLLKWHNALKEAEAVKPIIAAEQAARRELIAALYPTPKEGVNTLVLGGGWKLKYTHKIDRKIDHSMLSAVAVELGPYNVSVDSLIEWKAALATKAYKELTAEARAIFDQAITAKPGSPVLEMVPPKEDKAAV